MNKGCWKGRNSTFGWDFDLTVVIGIPVCTRPRNFIRITASATQPQRRLNFRDGGCRVIFYYFCLYIKLDDTVVFERRRYLQETLVVVDTVGLRDAVSGKAGTAWEPWKSMMTIKIIIIEQLCSSKRRRSLSGDILHTSPTHTSPRISGANRDTKTETPKTSIAWTMGRWYPSPAD